MRVAGLFLALLWVANAGAQWQMQDAHTTADLRGIDSLGGGVAWASGTNGTVLRTEDAGFVWQLCAIPPGAEKLDFRGIQAFDHNTAIVMSSGTGDLSRLYKTTDGCQTWKLIATNPEKDGFWDAVQAENPEKVFLLGDSVASQLRVWEWKDGWDDRELELSYRLRGRAASGEGSFAASNSVLQLVRTPQVDKKWKYILRFSSGTPNAAYFTLVRDESTPACEPCAEEKKRVEVPMSTGTATSGIYSFSFRNDLEGVAVGGDYLKPQSSVKTAAFTADGGQSWTLATTPPHGYRSAVAYDAAHKTWITVGPNGTDLSSDDGRNWRPLRPTALDPPDADQHWNALSLPFVVGPHGRIGTLRQDVLK
jgi:photosystem II stability/assembly factor-like uncharacterized protein